MGFNSAFKVLTSRMYVTKSTTPKVHPTVKWWDKFSETNERMVDII